MAVRNRRLAQLTLVAIFGLLATWHTWPMPADPAHLTRLDNNDTAFNTWVVAWVAHQVVRNPFGLFDAPIFYPATNALAFSEHMLVQGLLGAPLSWAGVSPVTVYNLLVWLGYALSGAAMALLMRAWTGSMTAAVIAGSLYAFNAHLLTRYAHLQALHLEFFPVVLYAFDRLLRTPAPRYAAALAAAFVVQSLCSNYTMVMMATALVVAFLVRGETWRGDRRMWGGLVAAGALVALVLLPFLLPYYAVREEQGLVRTIDDVRIYSARWTDYLATAGRFHYDMWSHRFFNGGAALFPGVVGFGLALSTVVSGAALTDPRARMVLAFGVVGFVLSFGAALPGYDWLQSHIPLLQGIRAVSRWGLLFLIAVAVLAGFAVAAAEARWKERRWWPLVAIALVVGVTIEASRAPLTMHYYRGIPLVHERLAREPVRAMVVFPLFGGNQFNLNSEYLLHQTRHWKPMLNAYSSFAPPIFYDLADRLQTFPSADAIGTLREHGFSHVLLHRVPLERDYGAAALAALRQHPDLEFVFEEDGVILYRVR